jgi:hypothetical protein
MEPEIPPLITVNTVGSARHLTPAARRDTNVVWSGIRRGLPQIRSVEAGNTVSAAGGAAPSRSRGLGRDRGIGLEMHDVKDLG